MPGLAAILGRFMIKEPGYNFARLSSDRAPTYLLSFEYQGENSFFTFLAPDSAEVKVDFVSFSFKKKFVFRILSVQGSLTRMTSNTSFIPEYLPSVSQFLNML